MENPEISPCLYNILILNKDIKNAQPGKDSLLNKPCEENGYSQRNETGLLPDSIQKNQLTVEY